ncbi:MAG: hypothetical protein ACLQGV_20595 [Bryobacteraceae bacterium]
MLRELVGSPAKKIYCGAGVLLLFLSPYYGRHLSPSFCFLLGWCLAVLSGVFAFLQDELTLSARAKTLLACAYAIGAVMMVTTYPWPEDIIVKGVRDAVWKPNLGLLDLAFPVLFLLPVGALFVDALSSPRKWPERAYKLAGLCLLVAIAARCWCDLLSFHLGLDSSGRAGFAEFYWMPMWAVATMGLLLASVPHELHRPIWAESALAIAYLGAAILVLLTVCEIRAGGANADIANMIGIPACAFLLGVLLPALVMTLKWVAYAGQRRSA